MLEWWVFDTTRVVEVSTPNEYIMSYSSMYLEYTDISRKVVGKSASDNP